jgi:hypothetical protein
MQLSAKTKTYLNTVATRLKMNIACGKRRRARQEFYQSA